MSKRIDTVFVLALITLFAATSFLLVLIGAKQYRFVTDSMNKNYEKRTVSSYLTEKIRQNDSTDAISVVTLDGTTALSLKAMENDVSYITYIYYYEGALCELVVTEHSVFTLSGGQKILPLQSFSPDFAEDRLLHISITDSLGEAYDMYLTIHCAVGKEAS